MERKNDIIQDSYYLINLFHEDEKDVTQLHIQKLMFLFEAYYMNAMNTDKLYDCGYKAWAFGPVAPRLYKRYKNCGKDDIQLTEDEIKWGNEITDEKKELMKKLYNTFKDFSAMELVAFTHSIGSPWYEVWNTNKYGDIPKSKMKDWLNQFVEQREKAK